MPKKKLSVEIVEPENIENLSSLQEIKKKAPRKRTPHKENVKILEEKPTDGSSVVAVQNEMSQQPDSEVKTPAMIQNVPQVTPQEEHVCCCPPKKHDLVSVVMAFILGIMLTAFSTVMLIQSQIIPAALLLKTQKPQVNEQPKQKYTLPSSKTKAIVITDPTQNSLKIVDLQSKKSVQTSESAECCGGELYMGNVDPLESPDFHYTAFIDKETKNLWIMSNETLEKIQATHFGGVRYISGWSPNSSKLVYYVAPDTIVTRKMGMAAWETSESFVKRDQVGFYLLDVHQGTSMKLGPIDQFIAFIGEDRVLAKTQDGNDRLVIFNLNTFTADYNSIKGVYGANIGQYNFSTSGNKWAFMKGDEEMEGVEIILATFPQEKGLVVDSGEWAELQWPLISPNEKTIAYQKSDGFIDTGVSRNYIWLLDLEPQEVKNTEDEETSSQVQSVDNPRRVAEGSPVMWVDQNTMLIRQTTKEEEGVLMVSKALLNMTSGEVTPLN